MRSGVGWIDSFVLSSYRLNIAARPQWPTPRRRFPAPSAFPLGCRNHPHRVMGGREARSRLGIHSLGRAAKQLPERNSSSFARTSGVARSGLESPERLGRLAISLGRSRVYRIWAGGTSPKGPVKSPLKLQRIDRRIQVLEPEGRPFVPGTGRWTTGDPRPPVLAC